MESPRGEEVFSGSFLSNDYLHLSMECGEISVMLIRE
jgi:hypothetical protein